MLRPGIYTTVDQINIKPGETLTVVLYEGIPDGEGQQRFQVVELRVNKQGAPEAFSDDMKVKTFDNWKAL